MFTGLGVLEAPIGIEPMNGRFAVCAFKRGGMAFKAHIFIQKKGLNFTLSHADEKNVR